MNNFASSNEVFSWVLGFVNLERGQKPKSFRLDRMEFLAELTGNPHKCAPSIHIAGSKGKGSVTAMLASMLTASGLRTARYMSPHVIDIRERLCLNGSYFDEDIYCSAGNELKHIIEDILPASKNPLFDTSSADGRADGRADGCEPTFWEILTLLFFLCARKANCDVIVAETGMGGRLDSTNILDPLVSVITLIELEHTNILGDTITAIAGEKAGIIKKGKPLVLAKQNEEALQVFRKTAKEKNSPLHYFPETAELANIKTTKQGTSFDLSHSSFSIPIPGKVQAENAALAITALKIAFPLLQTDCLSRGLANLNIPGRFEKIESNFIIDGAHTPESLALCLETFCSLYGEGGILLFGCASDKDVSAMARIAHSRFSKIIITTPGTFKMSNPDKVYEIFAELAGEKTLLVKDTREAIELAGRFAKSSRGDAEAQRTRGKEEEGEGVGGDSRGDAEARRTRGKKEEGEEVGGDSRGDAEVRRTRGKKEEGEGVSVLGVGSFYLVSEIRRVVGHQ
ncbi:MAG: bifunctional folylpolyglutamate synthase/dihydrofolate synthase [Treponema sp.]|nr:bifunctional folylpolyglutamate synthase/dihydrofolate synthase [Treponema sp.]